MYVPSTIAHRKVVGEVFLVVKKIILDRIRPVPEAKDEIFVTEMGVILHHVPQDGPIPDLNQRLWNVFSEFSQSRAQAAAEQHNLHRPALLPQSIKGGRRRVTRGSTPACRPAGPFCEVL